MKTRNSNRFRRLLAAQNLGNNSPAVLAAKPTLAAGFGRLTNRINRIRDLIKVQMTPTETATVKKQANREDILAATAEMLGLFDAIHQEYNIPELEVLGATRVEDYERLADPELAAFCENVADKADANYTLLGEMGYAGYDGEYRELAEAYGAQFNAPLMAILDRAEAGAAIEKELGKAYKFLLFQLNRFVKSARKDFPDFYTKYQRAIKVRPYGVRHEPETSTDPTTSDTVGA